MTAIYDILETIAGTPTDSYTTAMLYLASIILTFMLIFGIFDVFYVFASGWWGR